MISITIADAQGSILRTVTCLASQAYAQIMDGEIAILGAFSGGTHYVDVATMNAIEKPPKPAGDFTFDMPTRSWVPIQRTAAELIAAAMATRSQMLSQSDWTQLPDVPLATKTAWAIYRQALRDITLHTGYPQTIVWPVPPV